MNVQSVCTQGQVCKDKTERFLHISDNNVTLGRGERCKESWCLFWLGNSRATSPCHKASLMAFLLQMKLGSHAGVHLLSFKLLSFINWRHTQVDKKIVPSSQRLLFYSEVWKLWTQVIEVHCLLSHIIQHCCYNFHNQRQLLLLIWEVIIMMMHYLLMHATHFTLQW